MLISILAISGGSKNHKQILPSHNLGKNMGNILQKQSRGVIGVKPHESFEDSLVHKNSCQSVLMRPQRMKARGNAIKTATLPWLKYSPTGSCRPRQSLTLSPIFISLYSSPSLHLLFTTSYLIVASYTRLAS
ncbi:hypothetical protein VNO77_32725 [Canavalia gladiata]|uniref:Uncharacterized protein n=1 Tax=Canavalia gladiata TaxID=3824 RepID=A0AAN9Q4C8_CANGL